MSGNQRLLIAFYALLSLAALIATWSQNLAYTGGGMLGAFQAFVQETRVNPASRSITVDIGFFLLAASAFMVIEARRLGVRFVWLYILYPVRLPDRHQRHLSALHDRARVAARAGGEA